MDRTGALIAWDDEDDPRGNVRHIADNDLTVDEVESVLLDPDAEELVSRSSGRPAVRGTTDTGRVIVVVYGVASDDPLVIRPITAYEVRPRRRGSPMATDRASRRVKIQLTPEQRAEEQAIREEFRHKPAPDDLIASGEYEVFGRHGDYLALRHFLAGLKAERQRRGLSLDDVAARSGIDRMAISRLENGRNANPTVGTLGRYAAALGKRIAWAAEDDGR